MKKRIIIKSIIALTLIFAMSVGMLASADSNTAVLPSSSGTTRTIFDDQRRATYPIYGATTEWGGMFRADWYLYEGNAKISETIHTSWIAAVGVQFSMSSDYYWFTVECDRLLNYPTGGKDANVQNVSFGTIAGKPTVKFYRHSNLIYSDSKYCTVRQASKLAIDCDRNKEHDTTTRRVMIYADGSLISNNTYTFPNRGMWESDMLVSGLKAPYYKYNVSIVDGYYRVDLTSRYAVSASVADSKGSASVATSPVDYGGSTTVTFSAKAGYNIAYITDTGTTKDITDAASYTYTVSNITAARNIVATTTPINYSISYNLDGGSVSGNPANYTVETATFSLKNPTKLGYTFTGWTGTGLSSASTSVSVAKGSTGNRSYTANWRLNTYTVNYEGNGATSGSTASQTFSWNESKALSSNGFKREHKVTYNANGGSASKTEETVAATFNGWEDRNNIIYNGTTYLWSTFDAPYYANRYTDLYAAFGYNKYSLVQHYNNHGKGENRDPIIPGASSDPTDKNYKRDYYRADRLTVSNLTTTDGATLTMYANWTLKNVTLPTATRTGYTLDGWYNGSTKVGDAGAVYTPTANVTLTAKWNANTYKVTLDNQGATTAGTTAYWYKFNTTETVNGETIYYWTNEACTSPLSGYKITVPTKTGYTFGGYYTATNGGGTQYVDANGYCVNNLYAKVAANSTLYAKWTPINYSISYNLDGGSVSGNPTSYNADTATFTLNNPTKAGNEFLGWTGSNGTTPQTTVTIEKGSTGDKSYTANWKKTTFTVKWVNHDGTVLETDTTNLGDTPVYDGATPEKEKDKQYRYEFSGWNPEVVPATEDATYTAVFNAIELPPVAELKIVTSGCKETQSFVFIVESLDDVDFVPLEVALVGNGQAIIKDVPTGRYTVTEEDPWTWRYSEEYEKSVTVVADEENTVTFSNINEPTIKKWLSGLAALFK